MESETYQFSPLWTHIVQLQDDELKRDLERALSNSTQHEEMDLVLDPMVKAISKQHATPDVVQSPEEIVWE